MGRPTAFPDAVIDASQTHLLHSNTTAARSYLPSYGQAQYKSELGTGKIK